MRSDYVSRRTKNIYYVISSIALSTKVRTGAGQTIVHPIITKIATTLILFEVGLNIIGCTFVLERHAGFTIVVLGATLA